MSLWKLLSSKIYKFLQYLFNLGFLLVFVHLLVDLKFSTHNCQKPKIIGSFTLANWSSAGYFIKSYDLTKFYKILAHGV
jgi:hypothetical protein